MSEEKTLSPVEQEFEEWWTRTKSHVDRPIAGSSALVLNVVGMIKVIAKEAWIEADAKRIAKSK